MPITASQFFDINIPYDKVIYRLGFAAGLTNIDKNTRAIIDEEAALAKKIFAPKYVVSISEISFTEKNEVLLKPGFIIKSSKIKELLINCKIAYGFAVTIGSHLENKRDQYIKNKETTRAVILDAIGSETADLLADIINKQIADEVSGNGFKTTKRFSPGYGDWEISSQKDFINWLGAGSAGISLNESYQMSPEKSVTAILGVYK